MRHEVYDIAQCGVGVCAQCLDLGQVLLEYGDGQRGAVGEVAIQTALAHSSEFGNGGQRRASPALLENRARSGNQRRPVTPPRFSA